jgi:hypothetical protein
MAEIAKSGTPSLATRTPPPNSQLAQSDGKGGGVAGEAIAAGDACYIKSDGLVWRATGAAANAAARVRGFAAAAAAVGEHVTLMNHVNFNYGASLVPGAGYYLSGTVAGGLADAPSTGGVNEIAFALDATRIRVKAY